MPRSPRSSASLLPRRCVACARRASGCATSCGPRLRALAAPLCARCGAPTALAVHVLPRLQPAALAHDGALRALARGPGARTRRALEARRDLARRAWPPRSWSHELPRPPVDAIAVVPAVRDRLLLRGADPPAELARELGALVGAAGRAARAAHARRAPAARARRRRAPPQRARRLRGARGPAPPGARRRRLHDGRDRRRMRPRAAPGGRRAGARGDARAHAPRSDLCARAAPWQTPATDVPERGGTRCSFRSAAGTWISRSRSASTPNASSRGSSAT